MLLCVHVIFLYFLLSYYAVYTSFFNLITNIIISAHPKYTITVNLQEFKHVLFDTYTLCYGICSFYVGFHHKTESEKLYEKNFKAEC